MKTNYKSIVLVLFAVFSLGLWSSQPAGAAEPLPATDLPMDTYKSGGAFFVNNSGQSAGYLSSTLMSSGGNDHACLWDSGTSEPTFLHDPTNVFDDFVEIVAYYINSNGQVTGTAYDLNGDNGRVFFWTETDGMIDIGVPVSWNYTYAYVDVWGLNDNGQMLVKVEAFDSEWYPFDDKYFIWSGGSFTQLTYTDQQTPTIYDIDVTVGGFNNSGQVAGRIEISEEYEPAVLWEDGTAKILTPGISVSSLYINSSGQVAGGNKDLGQNPWIYTPEQSNPLRSIDVIGQYSDMVNGHILVTGLNDIGQVLIYQRNPVIRAMLWEEDGSEKGLFTEIPLSAVDGPGSYNHEVRSLNELGQAIAYVSGDPTGYTRIFFWDPAKPTGMAELAPLTGMTRAFARINDAGLAAGGSINSDYTTYLPCTWQTTYAAVNYPPELSVSDAPTSGTAGIEIIFTASATDPDTGDTLSFSLDPDAPEGAAIISETGCFSWTPNSADQFTFTVRVADSQNFYDTKKVTIEIIDNNEAPTLTLPATTFSCVVGGTLTFTATATDPEEDTLNFQLSDAPNGADIDPTSGVFSWTPASAGDYTFNVEVVDAKGKMDSKSITVSVALSPLIVTIDKITREGKWLKVVLGIENTGTEKVNDVMVVSAILDGEETTSRLPIDLGANKDGGIKKCELKFNGPDVSSGLAMLSVSGSFSLGDFAGTIEVTVP